MGNRGSKWAPFKACFCHVPALSDSGHIHLLFYLPFPLCMAILSLNCVSILCLASRTACGAPEQGTELSTTATAKKKTPVSTEH